MNFNFSRHSVRHLSFIGAPEFQNTFVFVSGQIGSGGRIRTFDLMVMSHTS